MTASTRGAAPTISSTSGIVSRVSPPARSTGLLRLQRGGSFSSIAARRSSGERQRGEAAACDRVGGDDAPAAGGRHDHGTFGPFGQRLRGERRRRLERLLDRRGARDAGLAAHAVEDRSSVASAPVWTGRGPLAAGGRAALHEHERLARRRPTASRSKKRAPVGDAFDVREADRGRGVVGVEVEVVGDVDRRGVARATRRG